MCWRPAAFNIAGRVEAVAGTERWWSNWPLLLFSLSSVRLTAVSLLPSGAGFVNQSYSSPQTWNHANESLVRSPDGKYHALLHSFLISCIFICYFSCTGGKPSIRIPLRTNSPYIRSKRRIFDRSNFEHSMRVLSHSCLYHMVWVFFLAIKSHIE